MTRSALCRKLLGMAFSKRIGAIRAAISPHKYPIALFLTFRVIFSSFGVLLFVMGFTPKTADPIIRPYFGVTPVVDGVQGALLGVWQRFDVIHYQKIAASGFISEDLRVFPPLYPLAVRVVGSVLGGDMLLSAFVVSNISCLLFLIVLYKWLLEEGYGEQVVRRTLLFLLIFPTSFFLFVPYTESIFMLFVVIAFREARRSQWARSGISSIAASLARMTGLVISGVIAVEGLKDRNWSISKVMKVAFFAVLPATPQLVLLFWQKLNGFPSTLDLQARYWNRVPAFPWEGIVMTFERIANGSVLAIEYVDLLTLLGMLLLGWVVLKRLPLSFGVYYWGMLLFNLFQVRLSQPLSGQTRFAIALLPAFIIMAQFARTPWRNRLIVYPSLALLILFAGQFIVWGRDGSRTAPIFMRARGNG